MFTNLEEKNYSSEEEKNEILQLHNTLLSLIVTIVPVFVVIVLTSMSLISITTASIIVVLIVLGLYVYSLFFHLKLDQKMEENNQDRKAHLQALHRRLHSGPGYGDGYRRSSTCPNGLPRWENYLRKYGLLYDDLGNRQSVPDDGIKFIVVEYNTPTNNTGVSLSEIQVWESNSSTNTNDDTSSDYVVNGLTNIAPQGTIDVTKGFITNNDPKSDLDGQNPDSCPTIDPAEEVYYRGNNNRYHGHQGGHRHTIHREPIDENHYNSQHDPSTHSHNLPNARPIYDYHSDDHGYNSSVTHTRNHRSDLYDQHVQSHYLEGMTSGDVKSTLTNNNLGDQYLNIVTDSESNVIVEQETLKMGLYTAKSQNELYAIRFVTPTTLMNATVSLLNGNQEVLYSKNIKHNANVYTFKLSGPGSEENINTQVDNHDSSYSQKIYDVCPIPQNRRQYALQHKKNNPNNNMDCTTETFISTINLNNSNPKASPVTRELI